jgi:hypothetical protein
MGAALLNFLNDFLSRPANAAAKRKHDRLRDAAEHSAHDSPAQQAYGEFVRALEEDPARAVAEADAEEATARLKEAT